MSIIWTVSFCAGTQSIIPAFQRHNAGVCVLCCQKNTQWATIVIYPFHSDTITSKDNRKHRLNAKLMQGPFLPPPTRTCEHIRLRERVAVIVILRLYTLSLAQHLNSAVKPLLQSCKAVITTSPNCWSVLDLGEDVEKRKCEGFKVYGANGPICM